MFCLFVQFQDLRRCPDDDLDAFSATSLATGETRRVPYKRAHFGTRLPTVRTTYSLGIATETDRGVCDINGDELCEYI